MSAYKPPRVTNETLNGLAQVMFKPTVTDRMRVKLFVKVAGKEEPDTILYEVLKENAPSYLTKSGMYRVRMSADGKKIFSAIPSDASVTVAYLGISHKEGELPTPKLQTGKFGDYLQFILNCKVVGPEFTGLEIPVFLRYNFLPVDDGGKQVAGYSHYSEKKPSKHSILLNQVLENLGVWDRGPMKWADNLLPIIHKRALAAAEDGRTAILVLQDGYVTGCKAPISEDDWGEEADEALVNDDQGEAEAAPVKQASGVVSEPDPDEEEEASTPADASGASEDEIDWEG